MTNNKKQQGALVIIAMAMLAGVTAIGASLAKMQVSGLDAAAEFTSGNKSFNLAETAFRVGFKQFKDGECDPSAITGAAPEGADGSTVISQSLGDAGSFKLVFCPMDGTCYPQSLIPSDAAVAQGEDDRDDEKRKGHGHWRQEYGKDGKWLEWVVLDKGYRKHHFDHSDKKAHWRAVRNHLKHCHGPNHKNHNNNDPKCRIGDTHGEEDPTSFWMVTAVDTTTSNNQRNLVQMAKCTPGEQYGGNLFTGGNYKYWEPLSRINRDTGTVVFGSNDKVKTENDDLTLPDDQDQDVWFRGTFKLPVQSNSELRFQFEVKNDGYKKHGKGTYTVQCGEPGGHATDVDDLELEKTSNTIRCVNSKGTTTSIKCDGTVDADCKISAGRLHFNLGKMNTDKVRKIEIEGSRTELYNAFVGGEKDGIPGQDPAILVVGQWGEKL
ncbi:MAG: hypothetical protein HQM03_02770 [Magnetococcales bacterium]|nr:hypothetical protein [Magnetococcales bacterium]